MAFCWVTGRHRLVSPGYGIVNRVVSLALAVASVATARVVGGAPGGMVGAAGVFAAAVGVAIGTSLVCRGTGEAARRIAEARRQRVASAIGREASRPPAGSDGPTAREYPPLLDLVVATVGCTSLIAVGVGGLAGVVEIGRVVVGALFLGSVTSAMLLGHWYLVQPGLPRAPLEELVRLSGLVLPVEVTALLLPPGMVALVGSPSRDGWGGLLVWAWILSVATTAGLLVAARAALREPRYSAVMATTGLLYLAILTAFGTDLVARALL